MGAVIRMANGRLAQSRMVMQTNEADLTETKGEVGLGVHWNVLTSSEGIWIYILKS